MAEFPTINGVIIVDANYLLGTDVSSLTEGGIWFSDGSGAPSVDASNFFWDDINNQLLLGDGSAGNPAFSFKDDPNTGFYRFGADKIAIVTGGSVAVAVDNAQRVGVGVSTGLSQKLTVGGVAQPGFLLQSNQNGRRGIFQLGGSATQANFLISPITNLATEVAYLSIFRSTNTTGEKAMRFYKGDGTGTLHGQIGVDGAKTYFNNGGGNCGIGATIPSEKLHVIGNIYTGVDGNKLILGTGKDMDMYYDGTDGNIRTNVVAASDLKVACGTDKTLEITETVWQDVNIPAGALSLGASAPDSISILSSGNIQGLGFNGNATTEEVHGSGEIIHDRKDGTDIHFHVHWMPTNANAGNVKWNLEYSWTNQDGTFSAPTTISIVDAADTTAWKHSIAVFPAIDGSAINVNNAIVFRLYRDPTDGDDTYGGDAALIQVGIHYEVNTMGSRQVTSK